MAKKRIQSGAIKNRRARYDFDLGESFLFGIVLSGKETKSLRQGHAHLRGAYITIKNGELWLLNSTISNGKTFLIDEEDQTRTRKLLASRKEIEKLEQAKNQGYSIVPTEFLTRTHYVKVRASLGKGKKRYDKRADIRRRDIERDEGRTFKRA